MTDWSDLQAVLETVRAGGLSGAARQLGVSHATVARRIGAAEARLGARLFDRAPGGYAPTAAGRDAARAAERMEAAVEEMERGIAGRDTALAGPLVVTAPPLLVEPVLAGILARFRAIHPEIEVTLLATNELLNLHRREADIALRISADPGDTLHGMRVVEQRTSVYAAPDLVARLEPGAPLPWLGFTHWAGLPDDIAAIAPGAEIAWSFDDMVAVLGAARAGLGAARMPCFLGEASPGLARLPGFGTAPYLPLWALTHRDLRTVPRVRLFLTAATREIRQRRSLFLGHNPSTLPVD